MKEKLLFKIIFFIFLFFLFVFSFKATYAQDAVGLMPLLSPTITITPSITPIDTSGLTLYTSNITLTGTPNITTNNYLSNGSLSPAGAISISPTPMQASSSFTSPTYYPIVTNSPLTIIDKIPAPTPVITIIDKIPAPTPILTIISTTPPPSIAISPVQNLNLNSSMPISLNGSPPNASLTPLTYSISLTQLIGTRSIYLNQSQNQNLIYSLPNLPLSPNITSIRITMPPPTPTPTTTSIPTSPVHIIYLPTATPTPILTTTATPTQTPSPTAKLTPTPTSTPTPTLTPTPTQTLTPTSTPMPTSTPTPTEITNPTSTPSLTSNPSPTSTATVDSSPVLSITYPRIQTLPTPTSFPERYDTKLVTQNMSILNLYLPTLSWLERPTFYPLNLSTVYKSPFKISLFGTTTTLLPVTKLFIINK